tara:strand:+ start:1296 stop:1421 length:126 start_codon:yes stop_codon:yes gene_type:complete
MRLYEIIEIINNSTDVKELFSIQRLIEKRIKRLSRDPGGKK